MTTMTSPLKPASPTPARRWYQEPYVWLVIGGPLAVVLASVYTIYLAVSRPDPVLDRTPPAVQLPPSVLERLSPEERAAIQRSVLPANQGRNHAVTPELPKD